MPLVKKVFTKIQDCAQLGLTWAQGPPILLEWGRPATKLRQIIATAYKFITDLP
jgi:hypothetical protein